VFADGLAALLEQLSRLRRKCMEKNRARHRGTKHIYIHNDLSNAAYYHKRAIDAKIASNEQDGIGFECMACLIALAFTVEAQINFLGFKLIPRWNEREAFHRKVDAVLTQLRVVADGTQRPFSSIETLKRFRDSIAHGKPIERSFDEEITLPADQLDRRNELRGEWEAYCTADTALNLYEDVDAIWKQLIAASGLELYDASTHGQSSLTFIERIVET
jgi:hypothetical protein